MSQRVFFLCALGAGILLAWFGAPLWVVGASSLTFLLFAFLLLRRQAALLAATEACVSREDPIMGPAMERGAATLELGLALLREHPDRLLVRFESEGSAGFPWARLLSVEGEAFRVGPLDESDPRPPQTVRRERVVDWMVPMPDGTVRGGFTSVAQFEIHRREAGRPHPRESAERPLFVDARSSASPGERP